MKRTTMQLNIDYCVFNHFEPDEENEGWDIYWDSTTAEAMKKLGQLEDIEWELGIELITLLKAMFFGAYFLCYDFLLFVKPEDLLFTKGGVLFKYDGDYEYFPYSDFGKLWALTKEELE